MEKERQATGPAQMEEQVSVAKCAEITGIPYGWLRVQVKNEISHPPRYRRQGYAQWKVKPREVLEWYEESTRS